MRTKDKYTYTLNAVWTADGVEMSESNAVHPVLTKMEVKYERPSSEMYYEKTFNSEFSLVGSEYSLIAAKKVSTKFTFIVKSGNVEVARCTFRKSDCEIDVNHKEVKVKPKADNPYELLNGKLDDEIDLHELCVAKDSLSFKIRPAIQVYGEGSSFLNVYTYSGLSQKSVTQIEDTSSLQSYHFNGKYCFVARIKYADSYGYDEEYNRGSMVYFSSMSTDTPRNLTLMSNSSHSRVDISGATSITAKFRFIDSSTYYTASTVGQTWANIVKADNAEYVFKDSGGNVVATMYLYAKSIFYRTVYYHDSPSDYGKIGNDDPFGAGVLNCWLDSSALNIQFYLSLETTTDITEYGRCHIDGESSPSYYVKPESIDVDPLAQDTWDNGASMWVYANQLFSQQYLSSLFYTKTLKDWYTFGSALSAVLNKLDSRIDFEETEEYSKFLFSTINPILSVQQGSISQAFIQGRVYILQKSNILNLNYNVASNKEPVTLRKMLQFLKYALNCYWHFQPYIDGDGNTRYKFHVEHVYYYLNGCSYINNGDSREVLDLTMLSDSMNGKRLSFNTNNWSYEVGTGNGTATKIQYHWMDNESNAFNGYDLDVPEEYRVLTDDTTEERTIDWFSSDIDYLIANSEECSNDGFLVVWTSSVSGKVVPIDSDTSSITYRKQNYRLAISWLMQHILLYNIGSKYVKINNKSFNTEVKGVKSMRKATVKFIPKSGVDVTPDYKIKTEVGDGVVNTITTDLTSGLVTAELLYELED